MFPLFAEWSIGGIVTERRELTSKKNETWRGYVVKVASLGATYELQCTAEQFAVIGVGQPLHFKGRFEDQGGFQRLVVTDFDQLVMPTVTTATSGKGAA